MKLFKSSLIALALASSSSAFAASVAITNATVHTVTDQGVLTNATVVVEDGKITAINPESVSADATIDAQGKILTPGLIGSMNQLGLVEVGAVSRTRDSGSKKADITFDPSLAFNPKSTVIAYSRKGGITSNLVTPRGGDDLFKGQAFIADLSGDYDSVVAQGAAIITEVGSESKNSRAMSLQNLRNKFEDAQKALAKAEKKAKDKKDGAKEPKRDEKLINSLLAGEIPLVVYADRATDLLALIDIKKDFNIDIIVAGGNDAVAVAEQLAKAEIAVVVSATSNLPGGFDSLKASLETAGKLDKAGVNVLLSVSGDTHNLYQLRYNAGLAVANGMKKDAALAAVTANVADAFGYDAGRIAVGKKADLVLWSGDPFELSTKVEKIWIDGEEHSTQSRQDALRKRYTTKSDMPRAYTK